MIVSRFAPAPTGRLHLGHVVNALYVWGVARAAGGRVLLRIEDHDRVRSRSEYEQRILEDLDWLGFTADGPAVRQSHRSAHYDAALDQLRQAGLVYACECSRRDIDSVGGAAGGGSDGELRYPGTCAEKHLADRHGLGLRLRVPAAIERFDDLIHGPLEQCPADQCGDLLLRDRNGHWTYQFAVTVDDFQQGVTLVIRGDDLLASTGRQQQLARMLGRPSPPQFLHHPLVMKSASQKLSKSDGDTGISDLRQSGMTPADVIGRAAALAGLIERERRLAVPELAQLPGLSRLLDRIR